MKFYDDDMDELFNKAGRDYPLKTDPKNWDAVRAALHPEDGAAAVTQNRNRWRRFLPLLFLLMIPAVYVFIDKDNTAGNSQQDVKGDAPVVTKIETGITNTQTERTNKRSDKRIDVTGVDDAKITGLPNVRDGNKKPVKPEIDLNDINNKKVNTVKNNNEVKRAYEGENKPAFWNHMPSLNISINSLNHPSEVISLNTLARSLNQPTNSASVPNSDKKQKSNNRNGFYMGLLTAPDISTIKGQAVKGIGYSAGAIVGYTINNRWQVEGGMLWSRKKYYTDGKYFDKKGPGIPDNINVLWLDGGCEMFEFPVLARYNFSQKKNTFFASAGVTSYLMKTEDYNYSAVASPGGYPYKGYRKYNRSGDHLFANLQLSAGYKFSLSPKLNFRIEPYLKAPLKKIGIGKMPVTSTGLYFAITRDFR